MTGSDQDDDLVTVGADSLEDFNTDSKELLKGEIQKLSINRYISFLDNVTINVPKQRISSTMNADIGK